MSGDGRGYERPGFGEQAGRLVRDILGIRVAKPTVARPEAARRIETAAKVVEVRRDTPRTRLDVEKHSDEEVYGRKYRCSLATMCGGRVVDGQFQRSDNNNDRTFYGVNTDGKLYLYVADGVDGAGSWGGKMADALFRAVWQYGLEVDALIRGAKVISGEMKRENATLETGSTFSGLTLDRETNLRVLHTGDSKIYWYDADKERLTRLTHDYDAQHDRARELMEVDPTLSRHRALELADSQGFHDNELTRMVRATDMEGDLVGKPQAFRDDYSGMRGAFLAVSDGVEKYFGEGELGRVVASAYDSGGPDLAGAVVRMAFEAALRSRKKRIDAITAVAAVVS